MVYCSFRHLDGEIFHVVGIVDGVEYRSGGLVSGEAERRLLQLHYSPITVVALLHRRRQPLSLLKCPIIPTPTTKNHPIQRLQKYSSTSKYIITIIN